MTTNRSVTRYQPIIWSLSLRSGKPFFPGGPAISLRDFQSYFARNCRKIQIAEKTLNDNNFASIVYLGSQHLAEITQIAKYLYDNAIDPYFFAHAIEAISNHTILHGSNIDKIRLHYLGRDLVKNALDKNKVSLEELGQSYSIFNRKTLSEKADILIKLGIIQLSDKPIEKIETLPPPPPQPTKPTISVEVSPKLKGLPLFDPSARGKKPN